MGSARRSQRMPARMPHKCPTKEAFGVTNEINTSSNQAAYFAAEKPTAQLRYVAAPKAAVATKEMGMKSRCDKTKSTATIAANLSLPISNSRVTPFQSKLDML